MKARAPAVCTVSARACSIAKRIAASAVLWMMGQWIDDLKRMTASKVLVKSLGSIKQHFPTSEACPGFVPRAQLLDSACTVVDVLVDELLRTLAVEGCLQLACAVTRGGEVVAICLGLELVFALPCAHQKYRTQAKILAICSCLPSNPILQPTTAIPRAVGWPWSN